ncbi:MAG: TetR/AcrR family transcriptional regulator [Pseudoclavibacter sp.]
MKRAETATGTTERRGNNARRRIVEAAVALFGEQGVECTSLQQIAQHVGMTKAALFYYFKSRDTLLTTIVAEFVNDVRPVVRRSQEVPPELRPRAALFSMVPFCVEHRQVISALFHSRSLPETPETAELRSLTDTSARILSPDDGPAASTAPGWILLYGIVGLCCDTNSGLTSAELQESIWDAIRGLQRFVQE